MVMRLTCAFVLQGIVGCAEESLLTLAVGGGMLVCEGVVGAGDATLVTAAALVLAAAARCESEEKIKKQLNFDKTKFLIKIKKRPKMEQSTGFTP